MITLPSYLSFLLVAGRLGEKRDGFLIAVFNRRFRMVSLNANGLRQASKRRAIFKELRAQKADFYLLQETHSTPEDQRVWTSEWGGKVFFSHGRSNSRGVAILLDRNSDLTVTGSWSDENGRLLILHISSEKDCLTIVNIYAPTQSEPREQLAFIIKCEETLADLEIQDLFLAGDLNPQFSATTSSSERDSISNGATYRSHIQALMSDYSLMDVWKIKNPKST